MTKNLIALVLVFVTFCVVVNGNGYVPVYVMLPLDTMTIQGTVNDSSLLNSWMTALAQGGVDGVMFDVWWGVVEREAPKKYNWAGYEQLFGMIAALNLKAQVVMSFHSCGGNVGDSCNITLPPWVLEVASSNPDVLYTDEQGHHDPEYLSLGVDYEKIFQGRSPLEIYADYMQSFASTFKEYFPNTITLVEIGMGPAGELRYPAYQSAYWTFCGIGEFQCYDSYMLANLSEAASHFGHSSYGHGGPDNAGTYDSTPSQTGFFSDNGGNNWSSDYGVFFLTWYSNMLIAHGEAVLSQAVDVFHPLGVALAGKVAGVHWWFLTDSHAAELTAGYYNTRYRNGYEDIANMFARLGVGFDFTCLEMTDSEQPASCDCGPVELVNQTEVTAKDAGVPYYGENALPVFASSNYGQIEYEASRNGFISGFSYLRLGATLMEEPNLSTFLSFVSTMHNLGS